MVAVALPDLWEKRGVAGVSHALYRLRLPASNELQWVLVPKLRQNAQFYLNGALIWTGGRTDPPLTRHGNVPFFFALPPALMRSDGNELLVRVAATPGTSGGLSVVHVGAHDELWPMVSSRRFWQNYGIYATSAVVGATAIYTLMIWLQARRRDRSYLYLAIAGMIWSLRNLNLVWIDLPTSSPRLRWFIELLLFSGHGWFLGFFGLFLLDNYGSMLRPRAAHAMRTATVGFMLLGPVLLLAIGSHSPALTVWFVLGAPVILIMAVILALQAWRTRTSTAVGFAAAFVVFIGLSAYDNMLLMRAASFGNVYLAPYGGLIFFMASAQMLVAHHSQLLRERESLNASLERRLAEREAELRVNYDALQRAERERAALGERERIMRDLHDGVGSLLLSAMHDVRHGIDAAELERLLQSCLDDLRLAVDSLEPHSNYPSTILGSLRYRLAPRLAEAGVHLRWAVDEVPPLAGLDPSRTLQLLRLLQEAITNVLRHARATEIEIGLRRIADDIEIVVRDNGVGFDTTGVQRGHGLANMRHRATQMGAVLSIDSGPAGTVVRLRLAVVEVPAASEPGSPVDAGETIRLVPAAGVIPAAQVAAVADALPASSAPPASGVVSTASPLGR